MKKTACVESRVDICNLAELALFYSSLGVKRLTKSSIIAMAVVDLANLFVVNEKIERVETTEEAMKILIELVPNAVEMVKKGRTGMLTDLTIENVELGKQPEIEKKVEVKPTIDNDVLNEVLARLDSLSNNNNETKEGGEGE
jgi:hypothetical protein